MRVLLVEDDEAVRDVASVELADAGFTVLEARSGREALDQLGEVSGFDALFTDIQLGPGPDGWQVAEAFRECYPDLIVLYATGYSVHHAPVSGSLFYRKPYRMRQVIWGLRALSGLTGGAVTDPA